MTGKYTAGALNYTKKKITRFKSSDVQQAISYIRHTYDDMFIILYINMKVHHWRKIAQNRTKKITRFESSDVKHTFLYIRLNRYDDCFFIEKHYPYYTLYRQESSLLVQQITKKNQQIV